MIHPTEKDVGRRMRYTAELTEEIHNTRICTLLRLHEKRSDCVWAKYDDDPLPDLHFTDDLEWVD